MKTKTIAVGSGGALTYHVLGDARAPAVLLCNAPGMSGKFWTHILGRLKGEFYLICPEYRGFPDTSWQLNEATAAFDVLVGDALQVLAAEKVTDYLCLSWCLGAKIALALAQVEASRMRELVAMNMAFKRSDLAKKGSFAQLIWGLLEKLEHDELSIGRVLRIMAGVGAIPTQDFLSVAEQDDSTALDLYDLLDAESNFASLAFYMIDTQEGLRNYLQLYKSFSAEDGARRLAQLDLPIHVLSGGRDQVVKYDADDRALFCSRPNIREKVYARGSHFMLIEDGELMGREIGSILKTAIADVD
jgi:pimeloyl-ACP methyl ester carboxylesterase